MFQTNKAVRIAAPISNNTIIDIIAPSPFLDFPKLLLKVSPGIPVLIENPLGQTEPYFDL